MSSPINNQKIPSIPTTGTGAPDLNNMKVGEIKTLAITAISQLKEAQGEVESLTKQVETLTKKLKAATEHNETHLIRRQRNMETKKANNEQALDMAGSTIKSLESDLESERANNKQALDTAESTIKSLESERANNKQALDTAGSTIKSLESELISPPSATLKAAQTIYNGAGSLLRKWGTLPSLPTFNRERAKACINHIEDLVKKAGPKNTGAAVFAAANSVDQAITETEIATNEKSNKALLLGVSAVGVAHAKLTESGILSHIYETVASTVKNLPSLNDSKAYFESMKNTKNPTIYTGVLTMLSGFALLGAAYWLRSSKKSEQGSADKTTVAPKAEPTPKEESVEDNMPLTETSKPQSEVKPVISEKKQRIEELQKEIGALREGIKSDVNDKGIISVKNPSAHVQSMAKEIAKKYEEIQKLGK